MIKRLATHAVSAFKADVKANIRSELSADELHEDRPTDADGVASEPLAAEKKRLKGVKQAKIVRQAERVDPVTGKGRSKGYGFLEMHTHADALRVLRWANNNPTLNKLFEEWWKDEVKTLIQQEKGKDEDRVKRLKAELEEGAAAKRKPAKGTLIVEFSIENVQVVHRRSAIQKSRAEVRTFTPRIPRFVILILPLKRPEKDSETVERPAKKAKMSEDAQRPTKSKPASKAPASPPKMGQKIGSLIGRKRKQRKGK
jgi:nucleolar protein 4